MFTARILKDGLLVDYICQATVGEVVLNPTGVDYIWDGGAGTDDWHTVTNGRSNWVDSAGTPWPAPPGNSNTTSEQVSIGTGYNVKLNNPATIANLSLDGASLEINSHLEFELLVDVPSGSLLTLISGSLEGVAGFIEVGGMLSKESEGNFQTEVAGILLDDAEFFMKAGTLLLDNGTTNFKDTLLSQDGGVLTLTDETTRFDGASGNILVTSGILNLNSKTVSFATNTVIVDNALAAFGTVVFGSQIPDASIAFEGGTIDNKRLLEIKGSGNVEFKIPFDISIRDSLILRNVPTDFSSNSVLINLPNNARIRAFGEFVNNGELTLQSGGINGNFINNKGLTLKSENPANTLVLSGINNGAISQYTNVKYAVD